MCNALECKLMNNDICIDVISISVVILIQLHAVLVNVSSQRGKPSIY